MRLRSVDRTVVELRPVRYQFGSSVVSGARDWDANWLVVAGRFELPGGSSWSFTDPCLTTWEARELGSWLDGVRLGTVAPTMWEGEEDEPALTFTEPELALGLAGRDTRSADLRLHLSAGALPPRLQGAARPGLHGFVVVLRLAHEALTEAAAEWERDLAAFPVRR